MKKIYLPILAAGLVLALWFLKPSPSGPARELDGQTAPSGVGKSNIDSQTASTQRAETRESARNSGGKGKAQTEPNAAEVLLKQINDLFSADNPSNRDQIFTNLLPRLIQIDPQAAARWVESLEKDGPWRQEALRILAQEWTQINPAEAENWAAGLPDVPERKNALNLVCIEISQTNPAQAWQVVENHDLGEYRPGIIQSLAHNWAQQDLAAAKAWVLNLPAGEEQDLLLQRIAFVQSQSSPAEAAEFVAHQMSPGPAQTEAAMSVLHQWAIKDPAAAAAWVDVFPIGELKDRAQQELDGILGRMQSMSDASTNP